MTTPPKQPVSAAGLLDYLNDQPGLLTARTTSPAMNFSEDTIAGWMKDGTIPTVEFGNRRYVQQSWLRDFMGLPPIGSDQ